MLNLGGGIYMENKQNYTEERFDSYLNKTIIYASKGISKNK